MKLEKHLSPKNLNKQNMIDEEKKYYLGKILCTADKNNTLRYVKNKFNHVFIVFGFPGSGKDRLINDFLKDNKKFPFVKFIRTLTRHKRPHELDMVDGFFINKKLFQYFKTHHRFFYTYRRYGDKEFGYDTLHFLFELLKNNIIMVGGNEKNFDGLVEGIKSVFHTIPITTIFLNRPKQDIIAGIKKRGGDKKEIKKRIDFIKKDWYERSKKPVDYIIFNQDIRESVEKLKTIIKIVLKKS